jgi:hypothetical protein
VRARTTACGDTAPVPEQRPPDLLDRLLAAPGLYVGVGRGLPEPGPGTPWLARIVVTALPGGEAVSLDYEARSPVNLRQHAEHSVLGRSAEGLTLVMAHVHAPSLTILREEEPGRFVDREGTSPFPIEIHMDVPERGRLVHGWWFAAPGGTVEPRDVAELELLDGVRDA